MKKKISKIAIIIVLCLGLLVNSLVSVASVSARNHELKVRVMVQYSKKPGRATSTCSVTSNDQINDFLLAGWHLPTQGVTYKINYQTIPKGLTNDQVYSAISKSFATWNNADTKEIFNYGGATNVKTARLDGTNAILFKNYYTSAIAVTYIWYRQDTGELVEADTIFNKNYRFSYTPYDGTNDCGGVYNTFDLQNIATHEFGHWIGLDDLYDTTDKDLTMYGYGEKAELKKSSLGLGDISGANTVLP